MTADRISGTSVQGKPAVVARPATQDGKGYSFVAFEFEEGWVVIEVTDLPLEETLKIAEGIRCVACQYGLSSDR